MPMSNICAILILAITSAGCCGYGVDWSWCEKPRPQEPAAKAPAAQSSVEAKKLVPAIQGIKSKVDEASTGLNEVKEKPEAAPVKVELEEKVGKPLAAASTAAAAAVTDATEHAATTAKVEEAVGKDAETIEGLIGQVADLSQALEDVKANRFRDFLFWVQIAGFAIFAGGIPVFIWVNPKAGIAMAAGGLIVLGLAYFVNAYLVWIAFGAVAIVVAVLAYVGYQAWRTAKTAKVAVESGDAGKAEQDKVVDAHAADLAKAGIVVEDFKAALRRAWNSAAMRVQTAGSAINKLRKA